MTRLVLEAGILSSNIGQNLDTGDAEHDTPRPIQAGQGSCKTGRRAVSLDQKTPIP